MVGTKEFYDLMAAFERDAKNLFYGHKVERYPKGEKVPAGEFYQDGYVNAMFQAYMSGYQLHKCIARMDAE